MLIKVKVHPQAGEENLIKKAEDNFEIWTKAKPVQGQANRAVISVLAGHFGVPMEKVRIIRGFKQRNKVAEIKL